MEVFEFTVKDVAGVPPKTTLVTPVKVVPVMVTDVPPLAEPVAGVIEAIEGTGTMGVTDPRAVKGPQPMELRARAATQ
jgi:hypothetical protein